MAYKKSLKGDLFCPNVKGLHENFFGQDLLNTGALYVDYKMDYGFYGQDGGGHSIMKIAFDAARSSSIYTNNGHVRQLSLSLNYIVKS